jgi:hypothetical protein
MKLYRLSIIGYFLTSASHFSLRSHRLEILHRTRSNKTPQTTLQQYISIGWKDGKVYGNLHWFCLRVIELTVLCDFQEVKEKRKMGI